MVSDSSEPAILRPGEFQLTGTGVAATPKEDPRQRLYKNLHRAKIPGLDGIRGAAAMTVVMYHGVTRHAPGNFGVLMFFVLSGLLITWLMLAEEARDGAVNLRNFYIRRAFRLLPPLFIYLLYELLLSRPAAPPRFVLATALYCANYAGAFGLGSHGQMYQVWSLSVEEHFYIVWPWLFGWIRRHGILPRALIGAAVFTAVLRFVIARYIKPSYAAGSTETNATGILIGCALALWIWRSPASLPRFLFHPALSLLSLVAVVGLFQIPEGARNAWGMSAVIPFLAIILLQAITYEWRILENPGARFLGKISYSVYLWHIVALHLMRSLSLTQPVQRVGIISAAIAIGAISYYLIERPSQSWARKRLLRSVQ